MSPGAKCTIVAGAKCCDISKLFGSSWDLLGMICSFDLGLTQLLAPVVTSRHVTPHTSSIGSEFRLNQLLPALLSCLQWVFRFRFLSSTRRGALLHKLQKRSRWTIVGQNLAPSCCSLLQMQIADTVIVIIIWLIEMPSKRCRQYAFFLLCGPNSRMGIWFGSNR